MDNARFTIQATNPAGNLVVFYVYSGWPWKAATIMMVMKLNYVTKLFSIFRKINDIFLIKMPHIIINMQG